jgi:hypothetical protein
MRVGARIIADSPRGGVSRSFIIEVFAVVIPSIQLKGTPGAQSA